MKKALMVAAAMAALASQPAQPAPVGYSLPNGWAPQPGGTKPSKASKTAKNRARAKAAAKSRRQQRAR